MHENRVFFHIGVATLQAISRAVKHVSMLLIMFLESKYIFFRIDQVLRFALNITVLLETISRKLFYFIGLQELSLTSYICK